MASTYLSRTSGTSTNAQKYTMSFWVKRSALGAVNMIFYSGTGGTANGNVDFTVNDTFDIYERDVSSVSWQLTTNRVFRDVGAWYHIVIEADSTQATSTDRVKIYVNGVQETSFGTSTYPNQNISFEINKSSEVRNIGKYSNAAPYYFDGLFTHFHFIDGTAYDASTFGQTDATTGIWKPKTSPSVTYGTNGFFLKFENSANMDLDSSPNNLTFSTSGNLTQTVDTPSNVFCTLNPLTKNSSDTLANGNTKFTATSGAGYSNALSTLGFDTGKWYAEAKISSASTYYPVVGIASSEASGNYGSPTSTDYIGSTTGSVGLFMHADIQIDGSSGSPAPASYTTNDIVGLAVDLDSATKTLKLYKNGTLDQTYTITAPLGFYHFGVSGGGPISDAVEWNFGNGYFGTTAVASAGSNGNGAIFEYDCAKLVTTH
jgi:hypothetical protein